MEDRLEDWKKAIEILKAKKKEKDDQTPSELLILSERESAIIETICQFFVSEDVRLARELLTLGADSLTFLDDNRSSSILILDGDGFSMMERPTPSSCTGRRYYIGQKQLLSHVIRSARTRSYHADKYWEDIVKDLKIKISNKVADIIETAKPKPAPVVPSPIRNATGRKRPRYDGEF